MLFSRKKNEVPGTLHTILETLLGIGIGVFIAVAWLVFKPVSVVDAPPLDKKDAPPLARHEVVYISGGQGQVRQSTYSARVKAFAARDTRGIEVPEQDLNRWVASTYADVDRVKKWSLPPMDLQVGMPVFRFEGSNAEVGSVGELTVAGEWKRKLVFHAKGEFVQREGGFEFVPSKVYAGSCPVPFGFLSRRVFDALASVFEPGADAKAVWSSVSDVKVEKSRLLIGFAGTPKSLEVAAEIPAPVTPPETPALPVAVPEEIPAAPLQSESQAAPTTVPESTPSTVVNAEPAGFVPPAVAPVLQAAETRAAEVDAITDTAAGQPASNATP